MPSDSSSDVKFEIGHVLFIDIVGYSKLNIHEQSEQIQKLKEIVRGTEQFRLAQAEGKLLRLPTGDGGALVFRNSPEAPVMCALEISKELKKHPELRVRMGIHSGPVNEVTDLNEQANIAGAGINIAQRIMDCGDAGHILLSRHVAEDLEHYPRWRPFLHDSAECEVKHGVRVGLVNLYGDGIGNSQVPKKFQVLKNRRAKARWTAIATALLLAGVIVAAFFMVAKKSARSTSTIPEKSIAVLPFDNLSRDPENAYFSEGIHDEILTRLAKIADLKVISRTSTEKYKSAPDNLREIAKQLGVANILEGSVQKASDQVRVNVQLINAANGAHLWADTYDRKLTDIFAVESEIAKTVADTLQAKLSSSAEHVLSSRPTENPEAHELYLKGRYFWNRRTAENVQKAASYFQQAIDKDPNYALAYSGLADCHVLLPVYSVGGSNPRDEIPKALVAARKAVELDNDLAEAHTSLARALASNLQLAAAMPEFKRAIELNPNYATAHQWLGECLQSQGRVDEALVELKRAEELDPLSLIINSLLGIALDTTGRTSEAIEQLHKTIEIDPTFTTAHFLLGYVLESKGNLKEAVAEYEKADQLSSSAGTLTAVARAYFLVGRQEEARKIIDSLMTLSRQRYIPAYRLAVVKLAMGNREEALRLLEKSYDDRAPFDSGDLGWIKIDRRLDTLRSDPRFQRLLDRIFSEKPE